MTFPSARDLDAIAAALETLRALESDAGDVADAGAGCRDGAGSTASVAGLTEAQLLVRSLAVLGVVRAAVEVVAVRRIAALDRACALDPEADPVRAAGHRDLGCLLAELWKTSLPAARQLCAVARATAPRTTLHGEVLPAEFPELAQAVLGGGDPDADSDDPESDDPGSARSASGLRVSVEQAAVIIRELGRTGPGCTLEQRNLGERVLVEHAAGLSVEQVRRLAVQVRDRLDQDGIEPREQIQRRRRSLTISTTRDGMTHINWHLDAESAGHVLPQITAYVTRDLHDTRDTRDTRGSGSTGAGAIAAAGGVRFQDIGTNPNTTGEAETTVLGMPESRSLAQIRSDGAVEVFRHRAGCRTMAGNPSVTMIVRVGLDQLRDGTGTAEIDGVGHPVSAGTARRLAADANLIPIVLGGRSEVLDLGRTKRLFSPAQKHALAERDGGCAWTGCPHPPGYTQAHHIRWWDRDVGPTDLDNGILLCSHHHHRVHDDGWDIRVHDNTPWFTPPAHLDPSRTPRRGGRIRLPDSAPP